VSRELLLFSCGLEPHPFLKLHCSSIYKYISQYFFIERKYENWHDDSLPDKSPFSKELGFDE